MGNEQGVPNSNSNPPTNDEISRWQERAGSNDAGDGIFNPSTYPFPIMTACRIVIIAPRSGDDSLLELVNLPKEARILATGQNLEELRAEHDDLFAEVLTYYNPSKHSTPKAFYYVPTRQMLSLMSLATRRFSQKFLMKCPL